MFSCDLIQENAPATDTTPTSQGDVAETQEANNDSENPPSGDAVVEETPSQPVDELSQQEGGGDKTPADAAGADEANQVQEGGDGEEKLDIEDDPSLLVERQDHVELEVSS